MLREFHGAAETPAHRTTVGGGWDGSGEGGEPGAEAAALQGRAARGRPGRGEGRGESVADFVPRNCDCKRGNQPGRINGVEAAIKDLVSRPVPSVTGSPLLPKRGPPAPHNESARGSPFAASRKITEGRGGPSEAAVDPRLLYCFSLSAATHFRKITKYPCGKSIGYVTYTPIFCSRWSVNPPNNRG